MYVLMFIRLSGTNDIVAMLGSYKSEEDAKEALLEEYDRVIDKLGYDEHFSKVEDDGMQAFCGTYEMNDVIRLLVFDTEHPLGYDNNRMLDFHFLMCEQGHVD